MNAIGFDDAAIATLGYWGTIRLVASCYRSPAQHDPWASVAERPVELPPARSGSASMLPVTHVIRLSNTISGLEEREIERAWATIAASRQLLVDHPCPDMFLGRKTHEPFPIERERQAASCK